MHPEGTTPPPGADMTLSDISAASRTIWGPMRLNPLQLLNRVAVPVGDLERLARAWDEDRPVDWAEFAKEVCNVIATLVRGLADLYELTGDDRLTLDAGMTAALGAQRAYQARLAADTAPVGDGAVMDAPTVVHRYTSTACLHGRHDYCVAPIVARDGTWQTIGPSYSAMLGEAKTPATCKFCPARCECPKHGDDTKPCIGDQP